VGRFGNWEGLKVGVLGVRKDLKWEGWNWTEREVGRFWKLERLARISIENAKRFYRL
jgi:hypothetical protein